jgi:hypothetical protein
MRKDVVCHERPPFEDVGLRMCTGSILLDLFDSQILFSSNFSFLKDFHVGVAECLCEKFPPSSMGI